MGEQKSCWSFYIGGFQIRGVVRLLHGNFLQKALYFLFDLGAQPAVLKSDSWL